MGSPGTRRKVLIIEDEPAIRNTLYLLLASLGCEGAVADNDQQALAMVRRESFDAVLLDLRCSTLAPDAVISKIREIQPQLMGRVLVVTGEVADPATVEHIEQNCVAGVPRDRLFESLWVRLRAVLGAAS